MTADEIRALNVHAQEMMLETRNTGAYDGAYKSMQLSLLGEIAAQLAEINNSIASIQCAVNCDGSLNVNVKVQQ